MMNAQERLRSLCIHLTAPSSAAAATAAAATTAAGGRKPRLALVTTVWFSGQPAKNADESGTHGTPSHSVHMGDRFLTGWPMGGEWHMPGLEVVSAYVDQRPPARQGHAGAALSTLKPDDDKVGNTWDGRELTADTDQWAVRETEFGVTTYDTIAEALRCGGDTLAVSVQYSTTVASHPAAVAAARPLISHFAASAGGRCASNWW